jgi:alpha-beta hydrolase superfamily lysophospholipase
MHRFLFTSLKKILKTLLCVILAGGILVAAVFIQQLSKRPDLKVWHEADLDAEFTEDSPIKSFHAYRRLEDALFAQLEETVCNAIEAGDQRLVNRYHKGSLSDPDRWNPNWNRSFELTADNPRAGVLLLHGMSDSPYSLRNVGQGLNSAGAWVVGLRLPGHGTAPSGLVEVAWEDMAAAVRLAARHLQDSIGDRPFYIVGYSNGGALAVHYALSSLEDAAMPRVKGLVLVSPALGVSPLAAFAVWQSRLGHLFGVDKLAWNSIGPEYDPFKYQSFAVNAGDQVHRLTTVIRRQMGKLGAAGELQGFPPVLAFQSVADATVSTRAVIDGLFSKLPAGGHELVLFDINRNSETVQVLKKDPGEYIGQVLGSQSPSFAISLVTNENENSRQVVVRRKDPEKTEIEELPLGLRWPAGLYSLSHVALLFPYDDPLYGGSESVGSPGIQLGNLALRGERGLLQVSDSDMLRLRWNPFYPYLEQRITAFLNLPESK